MLLKGRRLGGYRFIRQHCIGSYIVDFCCPKERLIIEVDGGQHAKNIAGDAQRTAFLQGRGYSVLRFWNCDVMRELEGVLSEVERELEKGRGDGGSTLP